MENRRRKAGSTKKRKAPSRGRKVSVQRRATDDSRDRKGCFHGLSGRNGGPEVGCWKQQQRGPNSEEEPTTNGGGGKEGRSQPASVGEKTQKNKKKVGADLNIQQNRRSFIQKKKATVTQEKRVRVRLPQERGD